MRRVEKLQQRVRDLEERLTGLENNFHEMFRQVGLARLHDITLVDQENKRRVFLEATDEGLLILIFGEGENKRAVAAFNLGKNGLQSIDDDGDEPEPIVTEKELMAMETGDVQ